MEDMRGYFLIVLVCLVSVSEIQIKMNAGQYWTSDPIFWKMGKKISDIFSWRKEEKGRVLRAMEFF